MIVLRGISLIVVVLSLGRWKCAEKTKERAHKLSRFVVSCCIIRIFRSKKVAEQCSKWIHTSVWSNTLTRRGENWEEGCYSWIWTQYWFTPAGFHVHVESFFYQAWYIEFLFSSFHNIQFTCMHAPCPNMSAKPKLVVWRHSPILTPIFTDFNCVGEKDG